MASEIPVAVVVTILFVVRALAVAAIAMPERRGPYGGGGREPPFFYGPHLNPFPA